MEQVDCVVIGAGVVGLATARALARSGHEVMILEAARAIGTGTSSRNSEVIHAGIYYPPGSRKARLCVSGKDMLYAFCEAHGVGYRRSGKLIVASDADQVAQLEVIAKNAAASGVEDLRWLDATAMHEHEPALRGHAALLSPSTGIIDSHALMLALLGEAERAGATLALGANVIAASVHADGIALSIDSDGEAITLLARSVINSAGLGACDLARRINGLDAHHVPPNYLAKGSYFTCAGRSPFSHLIYPLPEAGGLGVHLTLDLGGQMRFGPNVKWVDSIDYEVDASEASAFATAVRRFWPDLPDGALQPGYAGIRPKISGPGEPAADFRIDGPAVHGVVGLVNLFGIESPGLTASLAIADEVLACMAE
ncbi:NAD(P)/FAD-dependent oxidoreductase [Pigmentiphaga aceris]|uniref:NAD(P)/FAD-dependent oxidoreductase n=1 Tax=Pigmentiphaga aceris TaxID=1940612 RepID=A0A5C0B0M7_9BURK|nr:NAD(P)/FAD-dependent oxidoreductase [Pigmentiphaga aceris]QEI08289.1 NAD(P)/FAD-dependent oxidoreductase [Pigmentiphaga aceris]